MTSQSNNIHIGVFDSGVGGLTVAKSIYERVQGLPLSTQITYFGDSKHIPYGNKSIKNIIDYSIDSIQFLLKKEIDIIVIACNTATALALRTLSKMFSIPILGVIEPGVKSALQHSNNLHIGVIGTYRTINSDAYREKLIEKESQCQIYQKACPSLVPIIEEGIKNKNILRDLLGEYLQDMIIYIDTLILGCTHYPLIKSFIKELYPELNIVDSCETTAEDLFQLIVKLKNLDILSNENNLDCSKQDSNISLPPAPEIQIYTNDFNEVFDKISQSFFPESTVIAV